MKEYEKSLLVGHDAQQESPAEGQPAWSGESKWRLPRLLAYMLRRCSSLRAGSRMGF